MSEETWDITLGKRTFTVPRLPFKLNRVVYPICQKLSNAGLSARLTGTFENGVHVPPPPLETTDEELDGLAKIAFLSCQAADPGLTQEEFDELPIAPSQLYDAFFAIRFATGGWRSVVTEDKGEPGEESGLKSPT